MKRTLLKTNDPEMPISPPPADAAARPDEIREQIAVAAYYKAERRGFAPGFELQDWLDSERELDAPEGAAAGRR